ncbi:MAG TPA: hypothetical protein VML35_01100 [Gaiellaceae bacterium]|nr:hypothetical protein [Gaiellaceae bacterium]
MSRRRAWAIRAAAALAVPAALVLVLLAVDVLRVSHEVAADDVRFQAALRLPRPLWSDLGFLPGSPGVELLGAGDDAAYRRTVALFARVQPGKVAITTPEREALRGRAQIEVTLRSRADDHPRRRAELLNLHGILSLDRFSTDAAEAQQILSRGIGAFQNATEVDPENIDAKRNLELVLRRPGAATLPPNDPSQGGAQGRTSGQGRSGSGY